MHSNRGGDQKVVRPNYRGFSRSIFIVYPGFYLEHSAKGSTWENHKYIKRINGTYYYPDNYEGGRHLPDGEKSKDSEDETLSKDDIISKIEDMTGMKREYITKLYNLSRDEKGYDSEEFKSLLSDLSEGDEDQANRMIDLLKKGRSKLDLTNNDIEKLAKEVIRGNFGNGQVRKDLLGENYAEVQKRVNEMMRGSVGSKVVTKDSMDGAIKTVEKVVKTTASTVVSGVDMDKVLSVYNKNRR